MHNINDYSSFTYATRNERGNEEVTIEWHRTFLQWLLRKPATIETFEKYFGVWVVKRTGEELTFFGGAKLNTLVRQFQYIQSFEKNA